MQNLVAFTKVFFQIFDSELKVAQMTDPIANSRTDPRTSSQAIVICIVKWVGWPADTMRRFELPFHKRHARTQQLFGTVCRQEQIVFPIVDAAFAEVIVLGPFRVRQHDRAVIDCYDDGGDS